MPNIYAYSIDYDGCLAGKADHLPKTTRLIAHIATSLTADADSFAVLMVGSYRQFIGSDVYCISVNKNGSCFPVYADLIDAFKEKHPEHAHRISFDPLLLADIHEQTESGEHFNKAIKLQNRSVAQYVMHEQTPEPRWHDMTKCGLQYVQMHHLASQFPTHCIYYYFHDNCYEDILIPSYQYFQTFKNHIPKNVRHNHYHYVLGEYNEQFSEISGEGCIDIDYRQTVQRFKGDLSKPINREVVSEPFAPPVFSEETEILRCAVILHPNRFVFFKELIRKKGYAYPPVFLDYLKSELIQRDYRGFLLHEAIATNDWKSVKKLLQAGANYLLLNERGENALSVVAKKENRDGILCFTQYAEIQDTEKQLVRFISIFSAGCFYQWLANLIFLESHPSVSVLLQHRLGNISADHADFAKYYIEKSGEKKVGGFHCTKTVVMELLNLLKKVETVSSSIGEYLCRFRAHTASLPGEHFQCSALDALCYIISEYYELKRLSFSVHDFQYYEFLFEILKMTREISEKMYLTNLTIDEKILIYYRWCISYQAIMFGKTKEELTDLSAIANDIFKRFSYREVSLNYIANYLKIHCIDIPWKGIRETVVETPKLSILKSIRQQANKNENNKLVLALFVSLQSLIAQVDLLPSVIELMKQWLDMRACDASHSKVREVLAEADDEGCTCFSFFSPGNMAFLERLPVQIGAVCR